MLSRSLVAVAIWLVSLLAIVTSVSVLWGGLLSLANDATPQNFLTVAFGTIACYAWLALLVLTIGWIRQRVVPMYWVVTGTSCAVISIAAFAIAGGGISVLVVPAVVLPGVVFASYVCSYHWRHARRS